MERKEEEPKIVVSPEQLRRWTNGEEKAPKGVRNRLKKWLDDPTAEFPFSERVTDQVLESYYNSLTPVPTSELPIVENILNDAIDHVTGKPEGTTTWKRAQDGDSIAKEVLRRKSRKPTNPS